MTTEEMIHLENIINDRFGSLSWRIGKYEDFGIAKWWWQCHDVRGFADTAAECLQQINNLPS